MKFKINPGAVVAPLLLAMLLPLFSTGLRAEWTVSHSDSNIGFTAFSRMHDVDGSFEKWNFEGTIADSLSAKGVVKIEMTSVNTGKEKRDRHLRNEDFFNTSVYPEATFTIGKMEKKGERVAISGELTMLGKKKKMDLLLDSSSQGKKMILTGSREIQRSDFGITYSSSMNPIEDRVRLNFKIVLFR